MKRIILLIAVGVVVASCKPDGPSEAAQKLAEIEQLYSQGRYRACLDSITSLRMRHPTAIEERKQALRIWQDASLALVQQDIARTDSALQATLQQIPRERDLLRQNMLRVRRDSLQARYDGLCGTVCVIHYKQKEKQE